MTEVELIIDLHVRNDRQGPGADEETERAIGIGRLNGAGPLAVADLGCGTGASSLALARMLDARVVALDAAGPFVERLRERAADAGLSDRIEAMVGDMASLPFEDDRFDVIWSEGAIYNIGFGAGLRAWRRCLRPGGVIAVSELTWTTARRPADVHAHWSSAYPAIDTASAKLRILEEEGYETLGVFFLPPHCWEANYYEPLRAGFTSFLARHGHSAQAREIVSAEEAEIALHHVRGAWYSYAFYIGRRRNEPT